MREDIELASTTPAGAESRIETLDMLRGFALFGMILVHFHQRFRLTTDLASFFGEQSVGWIVWWGVEQKAWATFAFLFGAGSAILMRRVDARGERVAPLYLRRLAVLAAGGLALHVLTNFQMLMEYAIWGVPLLVLRHRSTRTLLWVAVLGAMAMPLITLGQGVHALLTLGRAGADAAWQARQPLAFAHPHAESYMQALTGRLELLPSYMVYRLIPGSSFTLFLLGLLAVRHGVFDAPRRHVRLIGTMMGIGAASWLAFWLLLPRMPTDFSSQQIVTGFRYGMGVISDQWLAFTYIGALVLLLAYRTRWVARLTPFAAAGRMALTNYIVQCVAFECLSAPYGLNLRLRPYYCAVGAILMFTAQVVFSLAWLARFRFGPFEWIWRSLTYMRWQPLGRGPGRPSSITAAV
jgi:uncharacterized protein